MMKILSLLVVLALSCCVNRSYDKEFKNPLFNQPLRPLARSSALTILTPTSITVKTPLDDNITGMSGKCDLIENEQDRITLKCGITFHDPDEWRGIQYFTYEIKELHLSDCLRIVEYSRDEDEDHPSSIFSYCVTPPHGKSSKSD